MSGIEQKVVLLADGWHYTTRDGYDYELDYRVESITHTGKPEETIDVIEGRFRVGISRTLSAIWQLGKEDLQKVLYETAKRRIVEKVQEGTLSGHDELELTTANAPDRPLFKPENIRREFNVPIRVVRETVQPIVAGSFSQVAGEIIELRDNVNALAGELFGFRLLTLPQEKHLLDLFLDCQNREDFGYRVPSLAGLAVAFNVADMRARLKDLPSSRSIDVFGVLLRQEYPSEDVASIMNVISNLNKLRRMYPIHTDTATGVMRAFHFFGIRYPVDDYSSAWKSLLESYRDTLRNILRILRETERDV